MKKIVYIISMFVSVLLYSSCSALDMSPEDYYGSGNFWSNEAQVSGYMNGLQAQLRSNYNMFYLLGELRGGTQRSASSTIGTSLNYDLIKENRIDVNNTGISNWNGLYGPIMQVNHFIQKVEGECPFLSDSSRGYYLGQAYGLRALYYFMLYKTYGGVPLVTTVELLEGQVTADKFYVERATASATMEFIKTDIGKSETSFGATTTVDRNMWSLYATLMLKAEIYMWAAKVDLPDSKYVATGNDDLRVAKNALEKVIGATDKFELLSDFSKVFSTKNNKEVIFSLHFDYNEATNGASEFFPNYDLFVNSMYARDGSLITTDVLNMKGKGGVFRYEYKESFWRSYGNTDSRRDATFYDFYTAAGAMGCAMIKGIGSIDANNNRVFDTDIIVYRYADALLMMAECENGLGGSCAGYINQVRQRAYGDNYSDAVKYTDGSYAQNELAILHERDKEFVWEGKRWFDAVRLRDANKVSLAFSADAGYPSVNGGTADPLLPSATQYSYMLLWPLDVNTINVNNLLTQTPGYDKE